MIANLFMARSLTMAMRTSPGTAGRPEQGSAQLHSKFTAPARAGRAILAGSRVAVLSMLTLAAASCSMPSLNVNPFGSSAPSVGQAGHVQGFLGGVVAPEPEAALVGRQALSMGGNAADAAVAVGMTLAVTLPSRVGLGAGGACLAYSPGRDSVNHGVPEAIMFLPQPAEAGPGADRPAAVPMLARGLYLLSVRYGRRPFETLIVPAERMARFGVPVSRALAADLAVVAGPLLADPQARAVFSHDGVPLKEGDPLVQLALGSTLTQLRTVGVGDLYQGALAQHLVQESGVVGGPMSLDELRRALPTTADALIVPYRSDKVAFLPPPADGGLAAAAAFETLAEHPGDLSQAALRALAVAARWRQGGATAEALLQSAAALPEAGLPPLPASTSWATLDRDGNAVVCTTSLDNLFGTGRLVPGMGFLLAASPAAVPPPLYSAAIDWNEHLHEFHAEAGGSGQAGAPMAVAVGLMNALRTGQAMAAPVPAPGRADVISCANYLPDEPASCRWAVDPRSAGLAVGGN